MIKILLVDDAEDQIFLLKAYLSQFPYEIHIAENGQKALRRVSQEKFDLILMDMQMPVMDGYTATQKIRQIEENENRDRIPIIALTGDSLESEILIALRSGCDAHLAKPVKKGELIQLVARLLPQKMIEESTQKGVEGSPGKNSLMVCVDSDLKEVIPTYLGNRRKDLSKIQDALQTGDLKLIEKVAHQMKGTGAGYGFPAISEIGKSMELAAKSGDRVQIEKLRDELDRYVCEVQVVYK